MRRQDQLESAPPRCHKRITEGRFYCLGVGWMMEERYNQAIQSGQVQVPSMPSMHQRRLHNSTCNSDFPCCFFYAAAILTLSLHHLLCCCCSGQCNVSVHRSLHTALSSRWPLILFGGVCSWIGGHRSSEIKMVTVIIIRISQRVVGSPLLFL